jgi:hypothetical protein
MPTESQGNFDFSALDWPAWEPWDLTFPREDIDDEDMHIQDYRFTGFNGIYHLEKPCPSGGPALRLQVINAEHTPLQCIFGYHSSKSSSTIVLMFHANNPNVFFSQPAS